MTSLLRLTRLSRLPWVAPALACGCVSGFAGNPQAQAPARFPVTPQRVLLAMQDWNLPVTGVQVRLAAPVTATVAEPLLKVDAVFPRAGHEAMLRMACRVHAECLPFFASAAWPPDAPMPALLGQVAGNAGSDSGSHAPETRPRASAEFVVGKSSETDALLPVIYAGNHATLLLEGSRIHIQIHVLFVQSGHVGDFVRVTTPDRKQVYVAEVLTPELLKGEF